jgi:hypothetical protein
MEKVRVFVLDFVTVQEPSKGEPSPEMVTTSLVARGLLPKVLTVAVPPLTAAEVIWVAVQLIPIPGLGEPGLLAELETELLVIDETAALFDPVIAMAGQRSR